MKKRFCEVYTKIPCDIGWGSISCRSDGTQEFRSCFDIPIQENCRNLIEEENEPLFGVHLKEAWKVIKNSFSNMSQV